MARFDDALLIIQKCALILVRILHEVLLGRLRGEDFGRVTFLHMNIFVKIDLWQWVNNSFHKSPDSSVIFE